MGELLPSKKLSKELYLGVTAFALCLPYKEKIFEETLSRLKSPPADNTF